MYSLPFLILTSFLICLAVTPLVRAIFLRLNILDNPDGSRKIHTQPIPRAGGVAVVVAYVAAYVVLLCSPFRASQLIEDHLPFIWQLLPGALLVFVTGLLDDLLGLKPWQKLLSQCLAACYAYWAGVRILGIGDYAIENWWSVPVTVIWLVGCTNAFNLIDGVDGLASGAGICAGTAMLVAALLQNNIPLAIAIAPLVGSLIGFLRYNFNPASIFLGDCGSLSIGFLLGCYGVIWSYKSTTMLGMLAPIMALAFPLLDTSLAIVRRFIRCHPIFGADRSHIHHRLLDRGLPPRRVALILYAGCGLAAILSLVQSMVNSSFAAGVALFFCAVLWFAVHQLGYREFEAIQRVLSKRGLRRMVGVQLSLHVLEDSLLTANTVDECWMALKTACTELGFAQVGLRIAGQTYEEKICETDPAKCWDLRIPLADSDYLSFRREFDSPPQLIPAMPFVDGAGKILKSRLLELQPRVLVSGLSRH